MFGIGPLELIVIAIVAVVCIGPDKLPDAMRKFGKMFVQFRRHANDIKSSFQDVIHDAERELELDKIRELQARLQAQSPQHLLNATLQSAEATAASHEALPDAYEYNSDHYEDGTYRTPNHDHQDLTPDPFAHLPITPLPAVEALSAPLSAHPSPPSDSSTTASSSPEAGSSSPNSSSAAAVKTEDPKKA